MAGKIITLSGLTTLRNKIARELSVLDPIKFDSSRDYLSHKNGLSSMLKATDNLRKIYSQPKKKKSTAKKKGR